MVSLFKLFISGFKRIEDKGILLGNDVIYGGILEEEPSKF